MDIIKPSVKEIDKYLKQWDSLENYTLQESSLRKLFLVTYPLNNSMDDVLIKVCSLNNFYSTNIFSPFIVAKHIVSLKIDDNLNNGDLTLVNKIADVEVNGKKRINFYSFATKYCSHHKPTVYPIYDSYVEKMLMYFKKSDKFYEFTQDNLKRYAEYKNILIQFQNYYGLTGYNLKQIDKYLWQAGKYYFPKKYSNKHILEAKTKKQSRFKLENTPTHDGKYYKLTMYLQNSWVQTETLSYIKIEDILGFPLPPSAYKYKEWWANGGHSQSSVWLKAGWKVVLVELGVSISFSKLFSNA